MIDILDTPDASLARKWISENLINNITQEICLALANLIIIDHKIRLNLEPNITDHLNNCLNKIRGFLGQKVIADNNFSVALMLFTVAISPVPTEYDKKENILAQSEDVVVEALINTHFNTASVEERKLLKLILKDLLKARNSHEIMNVMQYEPELFRNTVMNAIKKYQTLADISRNIRSETSKIANVAVKHYKKIETFKQTTSKILTAVCSIALGAISVVTAGAALALVVVPASILVVSYAPKIGEKLGEMILNHDKFIINEQEKITLLKTNIKKDHDEFLTLQKSSALSKENEKAPQKQEEINTIGAELLAEVKKQLAERVSHDKSHKTEKSTSKSQDYSRHR
jgi:hypothetical protein